MLYIYILLLDDNKYYVGKTMNSKFKFGSFFNSKAPMWTTKYKPVSLVEIILDFDDFDE